MIHTEIHCQFNNFYRSAVFVGMNGKMEVNKHEKNSIHVEPFNRGRFTDSFKMHTNERYRTHHA